MSQQPASGWKVSVRNRVSRIGRIGKIPVFCHSPRLWWLCKVHSLGAESRDGWGALLSGEFQCRTSINILAVMFFFGGWNATQLCKDYDDCFINPMNDPGTLTNQYHGMSCQGFQGCSLEVSKVLGTGPTRVGCEKSSTKRTQKLYLDLPSFCV